MEGDWLELKCPEGEGVLLMSSSTSFPLTFSLLPHKQATFRDKPKGQRGMQPPQNHVP